MHVGWCMYISFIMKGELRMEETRITSAELKVFAKSAEFNLIVQGDREEYRCEWLYWAKKEKYISLKTKASWNWFAFFFGHLWFLYRKMYFQFALIVLLRSTIFAAILDSTGLFHYPSEFWNSLGMGSVLIFIMWFFFLIIISIPSALAGNRIYLRKCLNLADAANKQFGSSLSDTGADKRDAYAGPSTDADIAVDSGNHGDMENIQKNKIQFLQKNGSTNLGGLAVYMVASILLLSFGFIAEIMCMIVSLAYICYHFFGKKAD